MLYGQASIHDKEDELPESDDELIMNVLNGLGIQERPDVGRKDLNCNTTIASARSSYTAVDEISPKRCSVAFSRASDDWTIVSGLAPKDLQLLYAFHIVSYQARLVIPQLLQFAGQIVAPTDRISARPPQTHPAIDSNKHQQRSKNRKNKSCF